MHMADALLSPTVGLSLWATSGLALGWCSKKLRPDPRDHLVPLMGVLGAFIFAAQMLNFSIPGTGSSGHIGGGLLLSILLGGPAAFVVISSVLTVQALFFADGGLLALGANMFNLGILPCFIAYPLIYRPLLKRAGDSPSRHRLTIIAVLAAVISMQMGAFGVVLETQASGISSLPFGTFLLLMQPIHLAIGLVEGLATAAILTFIQKTRPDLLHESSSASEVIPAVSGFPIRVVVGLGCAALLTGGVFSWFASSSPDGLEWSIARVTGHPALDSRASSVHRTFAQLQQQIALMPDYKFDVVDNKALADAAVNSQSQQRWPAVDMETSLAGMLGGASTLVIVGVIGFLLRPRRARQLPHA